MTTVLTRPAVRAWTVAARLLALVAITTLLYTGVVLGIGWLLPAQADGSLVVHDGRVVGSELLGQSFTGRRWFQGRPSAVADDARTSGGSNLGPNSAVLVQAIRERRAAYVALNGPGPVPADALTASASGLDPDVSVANALRQAPRVAAANGLSTAVVRAMIRAHTDASWFQQPSVDVLLLNRAVADAAG